MLLQYKSCIPLSTSICSCLSPPNVMPICLLLKTLPNSGTCVLLDSWQVAWEDTQCGQLSRTKEHGHVWSPSYSVLDPEARNGHMPLWSLRQMVIVRIWGAWLCSESCFFPTLPWKSFGRFTGKHLILFHFPVNTLCGIQVNSVFFSDTWSHFPSFLSPRQLTVAFKKINLEIGGKSLYWFKTRVFPHQNQPHESDHETELSWF